MTTAAGLTIAIPCMLFAAWFQARAERYMCDVADCLMTAVPSFSKMEGSETAARISPESSDRDLSPRDRFLREGMV
jgi:hypothetical protein